MGTRKLTDLEKLHLLTMHAAGFRKEAREYATSLGVSANYGYVLYERFRNPRYYVKGNSKVLSKKWQRAVDKGHIAV